MREEEYSHLDKSCDEGGTAPSLENIRHTGSSYLHIHTCTQIHLYITTLTSPLSHHHSHITIPTPNPAYHPLANHYQLTQLAIQCPIPALCGSGDLDKFMVGLD